jgi:hypothetical protein
MSWSIDSDVWVERDGDGFATQLRHIQSPYSSPGTTDPYTLAINYLGAVKDEFDLDQEQINFLAGNLPPAGSEEGATSDKDGSWLRWRQRRDLRPQVSVHGSGKIVVYYETTVLVLQQTHNVTIVPLLNLGPNAHFDVFGAGLRVVLHRRSPTELVVTGATSTLQHNFNLGHATALATTSSSPLNLVRPAGQGRGKGKEKPKPGLKAPFLDVLQQQFATWGLNPDATSNDYEWCLFRYRPQLDDAQVPEPTERFLRQHNRYNLIPNEDYPAVRLRGSGKPAQGDTPPIDQFLRWNDGAVLGVAPLMAGARPKAKAKAKVQPKANPVTADALVFPVDPITQMGYPWPPERSMADETLRPDRSSTDLDVAQQLVTVEIDAPSGNPPVQKLRGDNVIVLDPTDVQFGTLRNLDPPPAEPAGGSFEYESRTNEFAAVNAYWQLDTMMRRLELFGLPFASYAPTFFPKLWAIHRAAIRPGPGGDGRCINAQVRIVPDDRGLGAPQPPQHKLEFRFALADLPPRPEAAPLGIACDARWVWHEFGHALIAGATGVLELPFAHSCGDALAAINCDPGSALALAIYNEESLEAASGLPSYAFIHARGVTFPWVTLPNRRHDRKASKGWSWALPLGEAAGYHQDQGDEGGYHREQVLSSTLFRLYRALGGDALDDDDDPDVDRRRIAADYTTYLIVRALGSLGRANTIPANDASVLASAMMDADAGTRLFDYDGQDPQAVGQTRVGGAVHKVVRWTFEKQGLFSIDEPTAHGSGDPEPIDVFIDDGRRGEYRFTDHWAATDAAVWLRHKSDNKPGNQAPRRGQDNYLYVRVWNRGQQTAFGTKVQVRVAQSTIDHWPDSAWLGLPSVRAGADKGDVPPEDHSVLGPFVWRPTHLGHYTVLVDCDAPGDRSNLNPATGLPCTRTDLPPSDLADLVPYDNNVVVKRFHVK